MWRQVADPLHGGERNIGRRYLECKVFTDQSLDLFPMVQRVDARDYTTVAMAEQVNGYARFTLFRQFNEHCDIAGIIRQIIDIKPLALRSSAAPKIERVDREACGPELLSDPHILAAMGIKAVT